MGVALADARLLIEKFKAHKRVEELASMVQAVRSGHNQTKKRKAGGNAGDKVKLEYSWHHYDAMKKKYCVVRLASGGGVRYGYHDRKEKLEMVLEDIKTKFFPNGKSAKGNLTNLNFQFLGGDKSAVENLNCNIEEYFLSKSWKNNKKFYLQTKLKHFTDHYFSPSDDDDDDFEIFNQQPLMSTPKEVQLKVDHQPRNPGRNNQQEQICTDKIEARELSRSEIISKQDEEFKACLAADTRKEAERRQIQKEKEHEQQLESYLQRKMLRRKALVPPEATMNQNFVVAAVIHISLGRITRFFFHNNYMKDVYNWVGSLSLRPETFQLFTNEQGVQVLDPNDPVTKIERKQVYMREVDATNFTLDVFIDSDMQIMERGLK